MSEPQKPTGFAHMSDLAWAEMELAYESSKAASWGEAAKTAEAQAKRFAALVQRLRAQERI